MAIRFDASGDDLVRSANLLDYQSAYTVMGWLRPVSLAAFAWATFYAAHNGSGDSDVLQIEEIDGAGTGHLAIGQSIGGTFNSSSGATSITAGNWYHVAIVRESLTSFKMYLNGAQEGTTITVSMSGRGALTNMRMGRVNGSGGDPLNGRLYAVKAWSRGLAVAEILSEMYSILPRDFTNLYGFWPMFLGSGERTRDYGGSAADWSETGTLTDEDPAPVGWGSAAWLFPIVPEYLGPRIRLSDYQQFPRQSMRITQ